MNNYRDGCRLGIKLASMAVATIGALVAVNANGYGVPATSPDAVKLMGMAQHDADNSQGVDGAVTVVVGRNQQYLLPVDTDNPLTQADVGKTALLTPNHTIVTSGDGLLQIGEIMSIEPDGYAWVEIGHATGRVIATIANQLVFNDLQNCTYANDTLTYTGGSISGLWSVAYQAITDEPTNVEFITVPSDTYLYVGEHTTAVDGNELEKYADGFTEGVLLGVTNQNIIIYYGNPSQNENMSYNVGDKIQLTIADKKATVTNVTTGQTWTSPQSDYLATPKYMGVVVVGTDPLTIKAL